MKTQQLISNTFLVIIELEDSNSYDRNLFHRMNYGGNRNWSNKDYENREARIDRILEMNPGV